MHDVEWVVDNGWSIINDDRWIMEDGWLMIDDGL